jgi:DeoR/GlpR family transcriptional regulator of sugar metabolism
MISKNSYELCGPLAKKTLADLNIGKMLMERSLQTIAVFDHTKIGKVSTR